MTGTTSGFGFSNGAGYVIETDSGGNILWSKAISSVNSLKSVISNPDGSFAIAGSTNFFGAGDYDMLLIQADSTGNFLCNQTAVSSITTRIPVNSSSTNLGISLAGEIGSAAAVSDSKGIETLICIGTDIDEPNATTGRLNVFPNPMNQFIYFELPMQKTFEIKIFDATGEIIFHKSKSSGRITIDCEAFACGIYFITATGKNSILTSKLIRQ